MEVAVLIVVPSILIVLLWKLLRARISQQKATKSSLVVVSAAAAGQRSGEDVTESQRLQALWRAGKIDPVRARAILDRASQLGLTKEMCDELKVIVGPRSVMSRCRVCGAPAIPGDDSCYTHHTK